MKPILGAVLGTTFLSCSDPVPVTRGVGPIVQERRVMRPIDGIRVDGGMDLTVHVGNGPDAPIRPESSGAETLLWIDGPEDLIPLVVLEPRGSILHVGTKNGVKLDPVPTVEIFTSRLASITADGFGEVRLDMDLPEGARLDELKLVSKGAVDFEGNGSVIRLIVEQSGAGDMHLNGLASSVAQIHSTGSGDVWAHASQSANVALKGSCDLYLTGLATIESQEVLGTGAIHRGADASSPAQR